MKTKLFITAVMIALTVNVNAYADNYSVKATVVKSVPLYDVNAVDNRCDRTYNGDVVCQAVAKPDRPFPLPVAFKTTVQLPDGTVMTQRTQNRYDAGVHVKMTDE